MLAMCSDRPVVSLGCKENFRNRLFKVAEPAEVVNQALSSECLTRP